MLYRKIKQEGGWRLGSRGEFLIRVVGEGLAVKVKFEKDLREMKNPTTWTSRGTAVQVEAAARPRSQGRNMPGVAKG